MHETIPKGNMGYDHYTVAVETTFVILSFSTRKGTFVAARAIFSNFFENQ